MQVIHQVAEVRALVAAWRSAGETVALVPTMGYLHAGHLSLVALARQHARRVVASIFVNPTQFGPSEDLDRYPRDDQGDRAKLGLAGTDALFAPPPEAMYGPGFETWVRLEHLPEHLCGLSRPIHFRGVATVCTKLFNIVQPDVAVFGEKDYQQLLVIRRLVRDLDIPVQIIGGPIVREPDGLAMSSRNANLSPDERRRALALSESLRLAERMIHGGERSASAVHGAMDAHIAASGGRADYVRLVDPDTLDDVDHIVGPVQATVAAFYGSTRLIDNRRITP
ncbi:MAG: pantothenate synthetase [Myxococcales bacterium]